MDLLSVSTMKAKVSTALALKRGGWLEGDNKSQSI